MRPHRILFVCIGNACRSQMAEAFANLYGKDVLVAKSAGTNPCQMIAPVTRQLMLERQVDLAGAVPKAIPSTNGFDLVVNMSGRDLPRPFPCPIRTWEIEDPYWVPEDRHREIRDEIEARVKSLVLELRSRRRNVPRTPAAAREDRRRGSDPI